MKNRGKFLKIAENEAQSASFSAIFNNFMLHFQQFSAIFRRPFRIFVQIL
jgi:hypothetical protein